MDRFWGISDNHSSLVEKRRNLITGYISPQFHLVFDDLFETVMRTKDDESVFNAICNYWFGLNNDWYAKDEHDDNGKLIYQSSTLEDVWLNEKGCRDCRHELENNRRRQEDHIREKNHLVTDIVHLTEDNDDRPPIGAPVSGDK